MLRRSMQKNPPIENAKFEHQKIDRKKFISNIGCDTLYKIPNKIWKKSISWIFFFAS